MSDDPTGEPGEQERCALCGHLARRHRGRWLHCRIPGCFAHRLTRQLGLPFAGCPPFLAHRTGPDGLTTFAHPCAELLIGAGALVGRDLRDLVTVEFLSSSLAELRERLRGRGQASAVLRVTAPAGVFYVRSTTRRAVGQRDAEIWWRVLDGAGAA